MTGASPAIDFGKLPAAEARTIFDRFVSGQPESHAAPA